MPRVDVETVYRLAVEGLERLDRLEKGLDAVGQKEAKLGKGQGLALMATGFQSVLAIADRVGRAMEAVGRHVFNLTKSIVQTTAVFERFEVQFETLLGSSAAASERIKELAEFAAKTPFQLTEIAEADRLLTTFGATGEQTRIMVGDMAASVGAGFAEVAMWVGRANDAMQSGRKWGEAAQRLQELGLMSGKARAELEKMKDLGASGQEVWQRFSEIMEESFGGGMERLAETFEGLVSTVEDTMDEIKRKIGEAGIFDALKADLITILNLYGNLSETGKITSAAQLISDALITVHDAILRLAITVVRFVESIEGKVGPTAKFLVGSPADLRVGGRGGPSAAPPGWTALMEYLLGDSKKAIEEYEEAHHKASGALEDLLSQSIAAREEMSLQKLLYEKLNEELQRAAVINDMINMLQHRRITEAAAAEGFGGRAQGLLGGPPGMGAFGPEVEVPPLITDLPDTLSEIEKVLFRLMQMFEEMGSAGEKAFDVIKTAGIAGYGALEEAAIRAGETERLTRIQVSEVVEFAAKKAGAAVLDLIAAEMKGRAKLLGGRALEAVGMALLGHPGAAAAAVQFGLAAAAYGAAGLAVSAMAASARASAEREFQESLPTPIGQGGFDGGGGVDGGGGDRGGRTGRRPLPITQQAAAPANITYNVWVVHQGAVVYGDGGIDQLWQQELLPRLRSARENAEI